MHKSLMCSDHLETTSPHSWSLEKLCTMKLVPGPLVEGHSCLVSLSSSLTRCWRHACTFLTSDLQTSLEVTLDWEVGVRDHNLGAGSAIGLVLMLGPFRGQSEEKHILKYNNVLSQY